jgi:hypothetical protein
MVDAIGIWGVPAGALVSAGAAWWGFSRSRHRAPLGDMALAAGIAVAIATAFAVWASLELHF